MGRLTSSKSTRWFFSSQSTGKGCRNKVCSGYHPWKVYRCAQAFGQGIFRPQEIGKIHCY
jgi:hypothetical protein